jgi:D-alanine-D-alanine ligase
LLNLFATASCVFPIIHGLGGEDGSLQQTLDYLRVPYVGCGASASKDTFWKDLTKTKALSLGIAGPRHVTVAAEDSIDGLFGHVVELIGSTRMIIKPACCGSSFGISCASTEHELVSSLTLAFRFSTRVLIEEYLDVTEAFVGVIGSGSECSAAACVLDRPIPGPFLTYADKYVAATPGLRTFSTVDGDSVADSVLSFAQMCFRLFGCKGLSRVDIFIERETSRLLLNEINTMPALAENCAFATAFNGSGWAYDDLICHLVMDAMRQPHVFAGLARSSNPPSRRGHHEQVSHSEIS